jgi:ABC-2 type transport system permease protein
MMPSAATAFVRKSYGGWAGETAGLVGVELRLMRRRLMSKMLLGILVVGFALIVGFQVFTYILISGPVGATSSCAPASRSNGQVTATACTPAQQQASKALQAEVIASERAALTFPTVVSSARSFALFMGVILLCILVGTVAGSEFSYGTRRLVLMRGASHPQVLTAQAVAFAVVALLTAAVTVLLSMLAGVTVGPAIGGTVSALTAGGWSEVTLYWLLISLTLFAYMLIALFLATLGRSSAAGIGGALGFFLVQGILGGVVRIIPGDVGRWLSNALYGMLGQASTVVIDSISQMPVAITRAEAAAGAPISGGVALLIVVGWCAALLVGTFLLLRLRDVTE